MQASLYIQLFNTALNFIEVVGISMVAYISFLQVEAFREKTHALAKRLDLLLEITRAKNV